MTSSPLQSGAILIGPDGRPTMYFIRWLNELRLGSSVTSDDATTVIAGQLASATAQIATLERRLAALEGGDVITQRRRQADSDDTSFALVAQVAAARGTLSNLGTLATKDAVADTYTISNEVATRTLDANDAAGSISATPTQAEVENIRDAVLTLADVTGTLIEDLKANGIVG